MSLFNFVIMNQGLPPSQELARFNQSLRYALAVAQDRTQYSATRALTSEFLLLGLLYEETGIIANLFQALNINRVEMRHNIETALGLTPPAREEKVGLTPRSKTIIDQAIQESWRLRHTHVGPEHLLLALLLHSDLAVYTILTEKGITITSVCDYLGVAAKGEMPKWWPQWLPESTIFILLLFVTLIAGVLLYSQQGNPQFTSLVFVLGGWFLTLALHEFGHAFAALQGGDHTVRQKGYLTLNPLRYTHPLLSIVFPMMFFVAGGIGFPGGAVYIQTNLLRSKVWHSIVSAAGPLMTFACLLLTSILFLLKLPAVTFNSPLEFWAGLSLLAYLQITSLVLTLLPLPPLDGFGIIAPYLPESILNPLGRLGEYSFLLLYLVLLTPNPITTALWATIDTLSLWVGIDRSLVGLGFAMLRFW